MQYFDLMKKLIQAHSPAMLFQFEHMAHPDGDDVVEFMKVTCYEKQCTFSVSGDMPWLHVKRILEKKMSFTPDETCDICSYKSLNKASCNHCGNYYCIKCYAHLFMAGHGIVKCPFCRNTFGTFYHDIDLLERSYMHLLSQHMPL